MPGARSALRGELEDHIHRLTGRELRTIEVERIVCSTQWSDLALCVLAVTGLQVPVHDVERKRQCREQPLPPRRWKLDDDLIEAVALGGLVTEPGCDLACLRPGLVGRVGERACHRPAAVVDPEQVGV